MDPATLTAIIQAIVTIITTLSGMWTMFQRQNSELERKLSSKIESLEYQVKMSNQFLNEKSNTSRTKNDKF